MNTPILPFAAALGCGVLAGLALSVSDRIRKTCLALLGIITVLSWAARCLDVLATEPTFGFDLAWVYNAAWNLAEGRGPWSDLLGVPMYGVHGFFLFPLFLPFYWMFDHISGFYIAQFVWGFVAVIPAWMYGRRLFDSFECGVTISLLYLLHPAASGFLTTESQPTIIGVPFLFLYLYARVAERPIIMVLSALLAAMAYEVFALGMICAGLADSFRRRSLMNSGGATFLAGAAALLLFVALRPDDGWISGGRHYAAFGGSPAGALPTLLRSPDVFFSVVFSRVKLGYLAHLLMPVFFLPLLAPGMLVLAVPEMLLVLLADPAGDMPKINSFYTHAATVVLLAATGQVIQRLRHLARPARSLFCVFCAAFLLQFAYHHTFVPKLPSSLAGAVRWMKDGPFEVVPFSTVPEGATITAFDPRLAWRFPRRRVIVAERWLSPRRARQCAQRGVFTEYLVLSRGAHVQDTGPWTVVARSKTMDVYRRR